MRLRRAAPFQPIIADAGFAMDMIAERLAGIPLLAGLTLEQRHRLSRAAERLFIAPGKTVVERGEVADAAYLCLDDCIAGEYFADGETQVIVVPEGSTIFEMAMIVETEAVASFMADGHARVIRLSREKVLTLVGKDPDLAEALRDALTKRLNEAAGEMRQLAGVFDGPPEAVPSAGDPVHDGHDSEDEREASARLSA